MTGRLGLIDVSPAVSGGRYPARAVVGERLPVAATVFREGHEAVAASVTWRAPDGGRMPTVRMVPGVPGTDRWHATITPTSQGMWTYVIEAWGDPLTTWWHAIEVKLAAGQDVDELGNDLAAGVLLLERAVRAVPKERQAEVRAAAEALQSESLSLAERVAPALADPTRELLYAHPVREWVTRSRRYELWVDRPRALHGAWYELFPRSTGGWDQAGRPVHGTFATTAKELPRIAAMGFEVVYLPPIHPIGAVHRKGPNNALVAQPDDVGSPWAIGSAEGGHDAIHPELGTLADFDDFVAHARRLGLEVALDLALQCAPDHPWVRQHPEWFAAKPDGSIAYAENPPKKYQDIYPLNFDTDPQGLYAEVYRVVKHWIDHGVRIFRVDNPHTKPLNFWHWLIWRIKQSDPDVLFLAEAFTQPAMMHTLARVGFTQSYTYFTWRTTKWELEEYCRELVAAADYMRPNFFTNTPDILHESLQHGGAPMFRIRAVLASLLSPSYGVYSGYELFENVAREPGSEEYLNSEKFQLRPRDYAAAEAAGTSMAPYLTRLNGARRRHPALRQLRNLRFHQVDDDALICWSKHDDATGDTVLVVLTLDPHHPRESMTRIDLPLLGADWHQRLELQDEMTGAHYDWGQRNYVRLDPHVEPAHVFSVRPR
ncbi:MAG: alpha-1,4-glucan--maltose-1-phosphate maltosyltransferase [Actinobacteria bacterium]|nr:alpha-1,4-glucan--maltose-1-phosphate maltosyltransferase [Actinomycetota bacterium]